MGKMNIFLVSMSWHQIKKFDFTLHLSSSAYLHIHAFLQQQDPVLHSVTATRKGYSLKKTRRHSLPNTTLLQQNQHVSVCSGFCLSWVGGHSLQRYQAQEQHSAAAGQPYTRRSLTEPMGTHQKKRLFISRFSFHELRPFLVGSVNTTRHAGNFRHHLVKRKN